MVSKKNETKNSKNLVYKGKNLVRNNNILCYGNVTDKFIVLMEILESKDKVKDLSIGSRISIALFNREDFVKKEDSSFMNHCECSGLYEALEMAYKWLTDKE